MFSIRMPDEERGKAQKRSRFTVFFAGLLLMWTSWWYCKGGDMGLFVLTTVLVGVAVAMPKTFPKNSRWLVWSWLAITLLSVIVNISRLIPDNNISYIIHRIVTVIYAYALSSIFFCVGRIRITSIAAGALPILMNVLYLAPDKKMSFPEQHICLWGFIILFIVTDDLSMLTRPEKRQVNYFGIKENFFRMLKLLIIVFAAMTTFRGVEFSAFKTQDFLLGLNVNFMNLSAGNYNSDLFLGAAMPRGFHKRERLLFLIDSDKTPGYIRENVFIDYDGVRWEKADLSDKATTAPLSSDLIEGELFYVFKKNGGAVAADTWKFEITSPRYLTAICLPGNAVSMKTDDDEQLFMTDNGCVYPNEISPERYQVSVTDGYSTYNVQQMPTVGEFSRYMVVPEDIGSAVSNWVQSCEGLSTADSFDKAVSVLQTFFADNFKYNMYVNLNKKRPLQSFMNKKEGFCIHFASATALMLRQKGVPTRVVGGFVCSEWNPWIDRYVVREREGHAWVEAWDSERKQWMTVETTPPAGIPDVYESPGVLRLSTDWVFFQWRRFLSVLAESDILLTIADSLSTVFLFIWGLVTTVYFKIAAIIVLLFVWYGVRVKNKVIYDDALRAELIMSMLVYVKKTVPENLQKMDSENWDDWLDRIRADRPDEVMERLTSTVEAYQQVRYKKTIDAEIVEEWRDKFASAYAPCCHLCFRKNK